MAGVTRPTLSLGSHRQRSARRPTHLRPGTVGKPPPAPPLQRRLSPLDAAFYALESTRAPMHLGWAAVFSVPAEGPRPGFEAISAHIESRLGRAPRYRQRLLEVPLGLAEPVWADDEAFGIAHHVRRASCADLGALVDRVMGAPLDPTRPLWELWVAERLDDGRIGVVGKAHHALVDGLAAVELMALLLDLTPAPRSERPKEWRPARTPTPSQLAKDALRDRARRARVGGRRAVGIVRHPRRARDVGRRAPGCARAIAHAAIPLAPRSPLNGKTLPTRHLAWTSRPLNDLRVIERRCGTTINDIVLAATAGALREPSLARGGDPTRLKAMVPVSVRAADERWGNRVAFLFPALPCDEPDAVRRLRDVHAAMSARKHAREADAADTVLSILGRAPRPLRNLASRVLTSPRLSNVTISNIPGPEVPLYLLGCRAEHAYPVVPLTAGHGISVGMTSVNGNACFGVYADGSRVEDADRLAVAIGEEIDDLLRRCSARGKEPPPRGANKA